MIRLRRIYDPPQPDEGIRVLVDGLRPRGIAVVLKEAIERWPLNGTGPL